MKLSSITIFAVGFFIMIAAWAYAFFDHYKPNTTEAEAYNKNAADLDVVIGGKAKAELRAKKAREAVLAAAAAWNATAAVHTPPGNLGSGGINLGVTPHQLMMDTAVFRDVVQNDVNRMVHAGSVKVIAGPELPQVGHPENVDALLASFYNYPALPFPALIFDFGTVTVQGTYEQILAHVRSYRNVTKYLVVADGLQLNGTSPNMTGAYSLTLVAYIRGDKIAPSLPAIQSGGSSTAGAAGGQGAPGGIGGGPGGQIDFGARKGGPVKG